MKRFSRLATVAAVAVLGVGVGASTASAYSISGGAYVGTATAEPMWNFSIYAGSCPAALVTYSGTASGADTTSFTPYYGGVNACHFVGFPSTVTQTGPWSLKVIAGPDGNGYYDGELTIPAGTSTLNDAGVCSAYIAGPQAFRHGINSNVIRMKNVGTSVTLEMELAWIAYTGGGVCFASGTDGSYLSRVVSIPGIAIS